MPLSEHEQKMLDEMERQLFADDPRLARAFAPKKAPRNNGRRIAIGLGAVVLGLVVLVLAVALPAVWLGVIAFIGMLRSEERRVGKEGRSWWSQTQRWRS